MQENGRGAEAIWNVFERLRAGRRAVPAAFLSVMAICAATSVSLVRGSSDRPRRNGLAVVLAVSLSSSSQRCIVNVDAGIGALFDAQLRSNSDATNEEIRLAHTYGGNSRRFLTILRLFDEFDVTAFTSGVADAIRASSKAVVAACKNETPPKRPKAPPTPSQVPNLNSLYSSVHVKVNEASDIAYLSRFYGAPNHRAQIQWPRDRRVIAR
jgi:hypothetical protein